MRKILLLGMAIALAATMLGLGVQAQLQDTEQTLSTAQAGILDLKVDGGDALAKASFGDCLEPNQCWLPDECVEFELTNAGCVDGYVNITVIEVTNKENGCKEPEQEAGDPGGPEGELGDQLEVRLRYREHYEPFGDFLVTPWDHCTVNELSGQTFTINDELLAGCDMDFIVECVDWPYSDDNSKAMSDIVEIKMTISLTQNPMAP